MGIFDNLQYGYRPSWSPAVTALAILVGPVIFALVSGPLPRAAADSAWQTVKTVSGQVRCVIASDSVGCEHGQGFPQAPVDNMGYHYHIAKMTSGGAFSWVEGNIPGWPEALGNDVGLTYGQTFRIKGWTILPSSDGTRLTNDGTGHGMFVSIENVYSF